MILRRWQRRPSLLHSFAGIETKNKKMKFTLHRRNPVDLPELACRCAFGPPGTHHQSRAGHPAGSACSAPGSPPAPAAAPLGLAISSLRSGPHVKEQQRHGGTAPTNPPRHKHTCIMRASPTPSSQHPITHPCTHTHPPTRPPTYTRERIHRHKHTDTRTNTCIHLFLSATGFTLKLLAGQNQVLNNADS